ncbi:unnamed protein product [Vitrella brassicaformis CCMP3155]|uniref:Acid phosphatase n=1 Tax=Vitrella brassicaformis (strain CCMP3155) TaxID=1169540 RepID=A0A0G4FJ91_VITBC|nr:unnamed protein product [Vitrella brassicaformis CCMP3155]|eukprot:CEM13797.1 unnamed protein product [Vitrella brassicaformis CCMP3155]
MRHSFALCLALLMSGEVRCDKQVKGAVVVHRHGGRLPLYKTDVGEEGPSDLTMLGEVQLYQLGAFLRRRYVDDFKILDTDYYARELRVRSSDYDRTLRSADALLNGLYPQELSTRNISLLNGTQLQYVHTHVPIHTVPSSQDPLLRGWTLCPTHVEALRKFYGSQEFQDKEFFTGDLRRRVTERQGLPQDVADLSNWYNVYDDVVYTHTYADDHHPARVGRFDRLNATDLKQVWRLANWLELHKYDRDRVGAFGGGLLAEDLTQILIGNTQGDVSVPRVQIYSAHYGTMLSLASALGLEVSEVPPYGSAFLFEIVEITNDDAVVSGRRWEVNTTYVRRNYDPSSGFGTQEEVLPLPFTPGTPSSPHPCYTDESGASVSASVCPLADWQRAVDLSAPVKTEDDWCKACRSPDVEEADVSAVCMMRATGESSVEARSALLNWDGDGEAPGVQQSDDTSVDFGMDDGWVFVLGLASGLVVTALVCVSMWLLCYRKTARRWGYCILGGTDAQELTVGQP